MARQNRRDLFDPTEVGIYHCVQRTVRRAWLCGDDPLTGKSYEHRRVWIQDRLQKISASFGLDCLVFAVMVNHLHVVLRNRPDIVATWSDDEVVRRWWQLFPVRRNQDRSPAEPTERDLRPWKSAVRIKQIRSRLCDISWFMRALAEPIARRSNAEDQCTGHFWEGRFKCQKLVDEAAVLACAAYVDLNPVRAGAAEKPEDSTYTSVFERTKAEQESQRESARAKRRRRSRKNVAKDQSQYVRRDAWLAPVTIDERASSYRGPMPSKSGKRASDKGFLAITLESYLKLLDWTGRQLRRDGKLGRIPAHLAPILERMGMASSTWCECVRGFGKYFKRVAGTPESIANEAHKRGQVCFHTSGSPLMAMT